MDNVACCAHLNISYRTKDNGDGTVSGWWECDSDCGIKFAPEFVIPYNQPQPLINAIKSLFGISKENDPTSISS